MYFEKECEMAEMADQGHPRSLISVPIESAYCSSIVTLVLSSSVSEILQVFYGEHRPHPYIPSKIWGVPLRLDCRCCGSKERNPKLITRVITFELTQHIRPLYVDVTDGQTDRRTTYDSNTALCTTCIAR